MGFNYTVSTVWEERIKYMIVNDEGGWKLTNYPNDPGGVTYGGMTYNLFQAAMRKHYSESVSLESFKEAALADGHDRCVFLQDRIVQIYFDEFCYKLNTATPLFHMVDAMLSCAVNLGMDDLTKIIQRICNDFLSKAFQLIEDGVWGSATDNMLIKLGPTLSVVHTRAVFMDFWQEAYNARVIASATEWANYAKSLEAQAQSIKCDAIKPKYRYWENLNGWTNRVNRYR